jgi:hypothetical protein
MTRLIVASVLAICAPAAAEPARTAAGGPRVATITAPRVEWNAPASCPTTAEVVARVAVRLERSLDDMTVAVEIDVTRSAGRFHARIDLGAVTVANDVRTLTSKQCGELADAVAVIVARAASEHIARRRVALREEGEPILVDTYEPTRKEPLVPRPWTIGARLSGVSGIGVLPQVGLGAEVAITLRKDHHLAELAATRWFASAAQFHNGAPAKVDVNLDVAAARYGWRPYELPLRGWVAVEVGNMRGGGVDLPTAQLEGGRWLAAGAGFGIAWQMTPWVRLLGTTETMLAVERARFSTGEGLVVYAPAPMSFRTTCGIEVGWQ